MGEIKQLHITKLGRQGDGITTAEGGDIYVPLTLPGETVKAKVDGNRGELISVIQPSEVRIEPVCKHYQQCGGCSLQHMERHAYLKWKQDVIKQVFAKAGIDVAPEAIRSVPHFSRRRAVMDVRRTKKTIQLGFHGRRSNDIVDLEECHILNSAILDQLPNLKTLLKPLLSRKATSRLYITATMSGLDISVENVNKDLDAAILENLASDARQFGIARLTVNKETIFAQTPPILQFSTVSVEITPGGFLQAVAEAETMMSDIIVKAIGTSRKVADLFCGAGTFTFPVARQAEVLAVEFDKSALKQLVHGYENNQGLKPISTQLRDLFHDPLSVKELSSFDAVIFDPPRAGASAQAQTLANSSVSVVIAVSCNPATLARDVKILLDGGYKLKQLTPIDQFLYSAHIEAVTVLTRN